MPAARANAKIFDTVENRIAAKLQNAVEPVTMLGRAQTVGTTATQLLFDALSQPKADGSGGGRLKIPEGTAVQFEIYLSCYNLTDDPPTSLNYGQAYVIRGVIRNLNGTTALPAAGATVTALDGTASHVFTASNVVVTANDTDDVLSIALTGIAAKTYNWRATAVLNPVSFFSG